MSNEKGRDKLHSDSEVTYYLTTDKMPTETFSSKDNLMVVIGNMDNIEKSKLNSRTENEENEQFLMQMPETQITASKQTKKKSKKCKKAVLCVLVVDSLLIFSLFLWAVYSMYQNHWNLTPFSEQNTIEESDSHHTEAERLQNEKYKQILPTAILEAQTQLRHDIILDSLGAEKAIDVQTLDGKDSILYWKGPAYPAVEHFTGLQYLNGYFTVPKTGFYQAQLKLTYQLTEGQTLFPCINIKEKSDTPHNLCTKQKEQAGWKGPITIHEPRVFLRKGDVISTTTNHVESIYKSEQDNTFKLYYLGNKS